MSKRRDQFAAAALTGFMAKGRFQYKMHPDWGDSLTECWALADAVIEAEYKPKKQKQARENKEGESKETT